MNPDEQWGQQAAYPMPDNAAPFQYNNEEYNENVPINGSYTQYTDYTNGATGEIGIGVGVTQPEPIAIRHLTHIPGECDFHWQFIRRHLQQVKALTAGNVLHNTCVCVSVIAIMKCPSPFHCRSYTAVRQRCAHNMGHLSGDILRSVKYAWHSFKARRIRACHLQGFRFDIYHCQLVCRRNGRQRGGRNFSRAQCGQENTLCALKMILRVCSTCSVWCVHITNITSILFFFQ